ncbi:MAG TPA: hypothetical protein VI548_02845 [Chitinophagaceae bacterium]|nr:hypothetical protein [Chitinophagaceae bacterium]
MNQETKIQLLPFEIELLSNTDLILTKNAILQKLKLFFEQVQIKQQDFLKNNSPLLPPEIFKISPKVSKGENYKGLPWLVLDYPRYFEKENVFAIRTMCWWGNFFSVTLHLSGRYKIWFENKILKNMLPPGLPDIFLCTGTNEWEHHFESSNYKKIKELPETEIKKIIAEKTYLKLAIKSPIGSITETEKLLSKNFEKLVSFCL